jgi:hypothetical protein
MSVGPASDLPAILARLPMGGNRLAEFQVIYLLCSEYLLVGLIWGLLALMEMRDRLTVKV